MKLSTVSFARMNADVHIHSLVSLWSLRPTHANIHVMADIYFGLACTLVVSALLLFAGAVFARRAPHWVTAAAMIAIVAGLAWFLRSDGNPLWMAPLLPVSSLIVVGNITLPAAALLCGMAFVRMPGHPLRRSVLLVPLLGIAAFNVIRPILGSPPPLGNLWKDNVCRQTSTNSCSAAAAATLLRTAGIDASENEMAQLSLTRFGGTPMAGVYRGLVLKTAGTPVRPWPFHCDIDTLRTELDGPVLLTVGLDVGAKVDPRYQQQWGWAPGYRHTIVPLPLPAKQPHRGWRSRRRTGSLERRVAQCSLARKWHQTGSTVSGTAGLSVFQIPGDVESA